MQDISLIFNEESIKARKVRVRGPYTQTQTSSLWRFTQKALVPDVVQEKKRSQYPGWNTGGVIAFVDLFPERGFWATSRQCARVLKE